MRPLQVLLLAVVVAGGCRGGTIAGGGPGPCDRVCGDHEVCVQVATGVECRCVDGFAGPAGFCRDVNECALEQDTCAADAECMNLGGSYACACGAGFTGDGRTCADVDECADADRCAAGQTCVNVPGSFLCNCPPGQVRHGDACAPTGQLAVGKDQACAVRDGRLHCWGLGPAIGKPIPFLRGGEPVWASVAVGWGFACGVDRDGAGWCWGFNESAQLGNGDISEGVPTPQPRGPVAGGHELAAIAGASRSACAISPADGIQCWGKLSNPTMPVRAPVQLAAGQWVSLDVSRQVGCGVRSDGTLWCWGERVTQVPPEPATDPLIVAQVGDRRWRMVTVGMAHACAIATDGALWCWGRGALGALGDGSGLDSPIPTRVGSDRWLAVDAGVGFTCAVRDDHTLWCWGTDDYGEAGDDGFDAVLMPTQIGVDSDWVAVSAGWQFACGRRRDDSVWCWGSNARGQLGRDPRRLVPTQVGTERDWAAVSAGPLNSCAIRGGALFCWGSTQWHAGPGVNHGRAPVPVIADASRPWQQVKTLSFETCAGDGQGAVWCLADELRPVAGVTLGAFVAGDDDHCALDDAGRPRCEDPQELPAAVVAAAWTSLAVTSTHGCGVQRDGSLWCWGENGRGEIGDGTTETRAQPVRIAADRRWRSAAVFLERSCAIRDDGALFCWGGAFVDDGADTLAPTRVGTATDWVSLTGGGIHVCGLRGAGALWCWGRNVYGELGDGTTTSRAEPVAIGTATWRAISAGGNHTCAIRSDRSLWCWGDNAYGQLGDGTAWSAVPVRALPAPAAPALPSTQ